MSNSKIVIALMLFFTIFTTTTVNAQSKKKQTESFKVWGNCGMCEKTIEQSLKVKGIKSADWNKDSKIITVVSNPKIITLTTKIISAEVEFDRYITLKEGTGSSAYYELVSLNLFKGTTVNEGHYESYVLSPDKRWYNKNDNNKITESESAFNVINNHKKEAYIFYYRRIPNPITREVADLLADSYGDDGRCAVAFHVSMETKKKWKTYRFVISNF